MILKNLSCSPNPTLSALFNLNNAIKVSCGKRGASGEHGEQRESPTRLTLEHRPGLERVSSLPFPDSRLSWPQADQNSSERRVVLFTYQPLSLYASGMSGLTMRVLLKDADRERPPKSDSFAPLMARTGCPEPSNFSACVETQTWEI